MFEATKPGGWLCVEDGDLLSLKHGSTAHQELFVRGHAAFLACMIANGYHAQLGLHLGDLLRAVGLRSVQVRGWVSESTGSGPNPSVSLRTFEKIRNQVIERGELSADEADRFLKEMQSPELRAITAVHFAAWGQRAA